MQIVNKFLSDVCFQSLATGLIFIWVLETEVFILTSLILHTKEIKNKRNWKWLTQNSHVISAGYSLTSNYRQYILSVQHFEVVKFQVSFYLGLFHILLSCPSVNSTMTKGNLNVQCTKTITLFMMKLSPFHKFTWYVHR